MVIEVDADDVAHRDAGDLHRGLGGQLHRLVELDAEAVPLRGQRDRSAERQPQEDEQPDAGGREGHHGEHREVGRPLLVHEGQVTWPAITLGVTPGSLLTSGALSRSRITPSGSLLGSSWFSKKLSSAQVPMKMPCSPEPLASWASTSESAMWASQEPQK